MKKTLYYVYDLLYMPVSYNIYEVMITMELLRRKKNCDDIHVVILPNIGATFSVPCQVRGNSENNWRLKKLIIESIPLLETISGYSLFDTRKEGIEFFRAREHVFPEELSTLAWNQVPSIQTSYYHLPCIGQMLWLNEWAPNLLPKFKPSSIALEYIDKWLSQRFSSKRRLLVINLREYEAFTVRNSSHKVWGEFCQYVDKSKYNIVILRDFSKTMEILPNEFEGAIDCPEACHSQDMRMALYQKADLLMSTICGTAGPSMYQSDTRYLIFVPNADGTNAADVNHRVTLFLERDSDMWYTTQNQRFVFETPTTNNLIRAFEKIEQEPIANIEEIEEFLSYRKQMVFTDDKFFKILQKLMNETFLGRVLILLKLYCDLVEKSEPRFELMYYAICLWAKSHGWNITSLNPIDYKTIQGSILLAYIEYSKNNFSEAKRYLEIAPPTILDIYSSNSWVSNILGGREVTKTEMPLILSSIRASVWKVEAECPSCGLFLNLQVDILELKKNPSHCFFVGQMIQGAKDPSYVYVCIACLQHSRLKLQRKSSSG